MLDIQLIQEAEHYIYIGAGCAISPHVSQMLTPHLSWGLREPILVSSGSFLIYMPSQLYAQRFQYH